MLHMRHIVSVFTTTGSIGRRVCRLHAIQRQVGAQPSRDRLHRYRFLRLQLSDSAIGETLRAECGAHATHRFVRCLRLRCGVRSFRRCRRPWRCCNLKLRRRRRRTRPCGESFAKQSLGFKFVALCVPLSLHRLRSRSSVIERGDRCFANFSFSHSFDADFVDERYRSALVALRDSHDVLDGRSVDARLRSRCVNALQLPLH